MKTIKFNEFMNGEYKVKEKAARKAKIKKTQETIEKVARISAGMALPLALGTPIGIGLVMGVSKAFAATNAVPATIAPLAVEVGAKQWAGETALSTLAHALDPVIDILVALSFPIASVVIVGSCFLFMFGNSEKAWTGIQNAGLGYVLIQVSPVILEVLKKVGESV
jgi:hypothetical protein